ncbi:ankyrin repeat and SOCS box protein 5-like [Macrosteles quadrilineatus]|uniref:ankyrin repeat and SOCS box protein 5-like n=1 Tax=Macrosteles quadrilineatus TaxID=74068 RepID=UPI0023E1C27D|nr:ankyrin repeat and SOCS box protein 5-like [Macrosteles quadrilineatus]
MVELLLKNDAYVNLRDEGGDSPLLVAVGCGHLETIRILLLYGAIPNLPNSLTNITPLHKAIDLSHVRGRFDEILKLLCSYNVDLDFPGGGVVSTPLVHALLSHNLTCAVSLIRAGADVNKSGDTRCMWPAHRRFTLDYLNESDLDVAQLIVAAGFKLENYPLEYPKDFSNVPMDSFKGWLTHMKFSPRRLDDLCRLNIRRELGNKALIEIPQMEIPHMLKRFLLFEDIYIKKRNRGLSEPREVSSFPFII